MNSIHETALTDISVVQPVKPATNTTERYSITSTYVQDVFNARIMSQRLPREMYLDVSSNMTNCIPLNFLMLMLSPEL